MELALCWSGYEERAVDFELLRVFVRSYLAAGGSAPEDWEAVYDSNCGRLEWLEYNIKRVLGIDCGADERNREFRRFAKRWSKLFIMRIGRQQFWTA